MNAPVSEPVRKPRWLRRIAYCFGTLVFAAVVAVALAPSLVEWFPELRNWGARRLIGKVNGDLTVDSMSAGWFEPVVIRGVRVVHPSGEKLVDIERIETDRVLWRIAVSPSDMGTIRIERPVVNMAIRQDGNNFNDVFAPVAAAPKQPRGLKFGVRARVVDGTFHCRSHEYADPWQITGINLGVGLRPASVSQSGKAEFLVEKGYLLDKAEASVGLCNDLLSFIAPVLAKVTYARGSVSIYLDDWRLPIDSPETGELSGMVTMHTVDAAPGPLTRSLFNGMRQMPVLGSMTSDTQLPENVQLARESKIPFEMVEGRIHHEGLRFSLNGIADVSTGGNVGLDKTLNIVAVLGFHPPNPEQRKLAVMRALYTQPWPIHIYGRLGAPEPDLSPLAQAGFDLVGSTLDDIQSGNPSVGAGIFNALNRAGLQISPGEVKSLVDTFRPQPTPPRISTNTAPNNGGTPQPGPAPSPPRSSIDDGPTLVIPQNNAPIGNTTPTNPVPPSPPTPAIARPVPVAPPGSTTTPGTDAALAGEPVPTPSATAESAGPPVGQQIADGVGIAVNVLQSLRQQREARYREQLNAPPNGVAPNPPSPNGPNLNGTASNAPTLNGAPPPPTGPLGRRPVLREGLRSLFQVIDESTQQPPSYTPPTPAATPTPAPTPTPSATPSGKAREF